MINILAQTIKKMRILFYILISIILSCKTPNNKTSQSYVSKHLSTVKEIKTIAFGSCNKRDKNQSYWQTILNEDPDIWIWGGDNVYGDTDNTSILSNKYNEQKNNEHYAYFRSKVPIIGTWDDHDYGQNDGNKTFAFKDKSKELLLEFLDVDPLSTVRNRSGVYQSYTFGNAPNIIKVLLLDTRTFQDPLVKNPSGKTRYLKSNGDILGKEQWNWLEEELYKDEGAVHIIMSSIQFLADQHGYEKWDNFPQSKAKMLEVVENSNARNVLFLSGDRHIGEVSRKIFPQLDYPLYDITSSGLTHSYEKSKEINPYRIGDLVVNTNFGLLHFDWKEDSVTINCQIKGTNGDVYVSENLGNFDIN